MLTEVDFRTGRLHDKARLTSPHTVMVSLRCGILRIRPALSKCNWLTRKRTLPLVVPTNT